MIAVKFLKIGKYWNVTTDGKSWFKLPVTNKIRAVAYVMGKLTRKQNSFTIEVRDVS